MRICMIGKFPPIEGGVSMQNYWMCRSMAERGHHVFVVTNAEEVEPAFRIFLTAKDRKFLKTQCMQIRNTEQLSSKYKHIPQGNPFVTKLTSLALETITKNKCQILDVSYLEPYSLAGFLASQWTGIPYVIRPAGSDAKRLLNIDQLRPTYIEILKRARFIVSKPPVLRTLENLGVDYHKFCPALQFWLPKDYFNPRVSALDINKVLASLNINDADSVLKTLQWQTDPLDTLQPTIGLYGKIGKNKGAIDLVYTLGKLKQNGLKFNFVCLSHGWKEDEETFCQKIKEVNIEHETRILPFLPHWVIPSFIKACTAICYLEQGFPIVSHRSPIPMEVLSCGTCLILSGEVADKQIFKEKLISGKNFFRVQNSQSIEELNRILEKIILNPGIALKIGNNGGLLAESFKDINETVDIYENLLKDAIYKYEVNHIFKRNVKQQMKGGENMEEKIKGKITLEELTARLERLENLLEEMTGRPTLRDYVAAKKFVRGIKGGPKWTKLAKEIHTIGRKYGVLVDYELRTLSPDGHPVQCECNCDCCCEAVA